MATLPEKFGRILRTRRQAAGMTQEDFAAAARLHRNTIGLLERGERVPSLIVIAQLAEALGCTMADLIAAVEAVADEDEQ